MTVTEQFPFVTSSASVCGGYRQGKVQNILQGKMKLPGDENVIRAMRLQERRKRKPEHSQMTMS
jgi:hypothetical protein